MSDITPRCEKCNHPSWLTLCPKCGWHHKNKEYQWLNEHKKDKSNLANIFLSRIKNDIEVLMSNEIDLYVDKELCNDLARLHSSIKKHLDTDTKD